MITSLYIDNKYAIKLIDPYFSTIPRTIMKSSIFLLAFCLFLGLQAQDGVGIGVTSPDQSAVLHIQSPGSFKGLLIPRYDSLDITAIVNPANGLLAFDTEKRRIAYFDSLYSTGGRWEFMRGVPLGAILMWSGNETDIPDGFALCDGRVSRGRQTPNLVSSFIRGSTATSASYAGALDVIPTTGDIDENTIYDLNILITPDQPCSAYDSVYTFTFDRVSCSDPAFNGPQSLSWAAASCEDAKDFMLIPTGCFIENISDCTVRANTTYYALTPQDCLNENVFVYWDLAFIMRVD